MRGNAIGGEGNFLLHKIGRGLLKPLEIVEAQSACANGSQVIVPGRYAIPDLREEVHFVATLLTEVGQIAGMCAYRPGHRGYDGKTEQIDSPGFSSLP